MLSIINKLRRKLSSRNSLHNSYVNELIYSIHRADIKSTLFSILWAAGPVTIIAITLGYYLSHGVAVPIVTVAYFSFYVFFVGLVGFLSKLIKDAIVHRRNESMQDKFLTVIEELYQNLYLSRRLVLNNMAGDIKSNKISYEILSKSHPTSKEVFHAFDLHFGKDVAEFAEQIFLYKENGFPICSETNKRIIKKIYKKIDTNQDISEQLREKFLKALNGEYTTLKNGVERKVGFLSKIHNCGNQHELFDLDDSSNAIALFIELLSGRRISYFKVESKFDDVKKDFLFTSIEKLRQQINQKYNHVYGIYKQNFLIASEVQPILDLRGIVFVSDDINHNLKLLEESVSALNIKKIESDLQLQSQKLRNRFNQNVRILRTLLKRMRVLLRQWHALDFAEDEQINQSNISLDLSYVQLEEKIRMTLAYKMYKYLNYEHDFKTNEAKIKAFSKQIVKLLEYPLDLANPSILTAIELSNGANLSSINMHDSAKLKVDTTFNVCRAVNTDIKSIRQRVKKVLVAQYA